MAEDLIINTGTKEQQYLSLIPQLKALCEGETNTVANLANVSAAIKQTFNYYWVGFYLVEKNVLVLGPFQGPIACTRIKRGKGVCGTAWKKASTLLVDNVDDFPGHIACSSESKSEIVVPLIKNDEVIGVLDIDHDEENTFDAIDQHYLNDICAWLVTLM